MTALAVHCGFDRAETARWTLCFAAVVAAHSLAALWFLPSHDVYTWDAVTLTGSVDSTYNASCGNGPGGTSSWPFGLVRY